MKTENYGATIRNIELSTKNGAILRLLVSTENGRGFYAHLDRQEVRELIGALVNFQRLQEQGFDK